MSDEETWFLKHYFFFFDSTWLRIEGYKLHLMATESLEISRVILGLHYYFSIYTSEIILDYTGSHHIIGLLPLHHREILTDMHLHKFSCHTIPVRSIHLSADCELLKQSPFYLLIDYLRLPKFHVPMVEHNMYKGTPLYPSFCPDQLGQTNYLCSSG